MMTVKKLKDFLDQFPDETLVTLVTSELYQDDEDSGVTEDYIDYEESIKNRIYITKDVPEDPMHLVIDGSHNGRENKEWALRNILLNKTIQDENLLKQVFPTYKPE